MRLDPCADHACDHCYLCDEVGICCSTVNAADVAVLSSDQAFLDRVREALVEDRRLPTGFFGRLSLDAVRSLLDAADRLPVDRTHDRFDAPRAPLALEAAPLSVPFAFEQEKHHEPLA